MVEIAGDAPPQGTVGDLYTFTITAAGDNPPSQWVPDGALPSGCQLDPNTGVLTGRLAEAGTYPFTVKVTDAAGQSQSRGFTIIVNAKLVMLDDMSPSCVPRGAQTPVLVELHADGGVPPYQWGAAPGSSWPEGLPPIDLDTGRVRRSPGSRSWTSPTTSRPPTCSSGPSCPRGGAVRWADGARLRRSRSR